MSCLFLPEADSGLQLPDSMSFPNLITEKAFISKIVFIIALSSQLLAGKLLQLIGQRKGVSGQFSYAPPSMPLKPFSYLNSRSSSICFIERDWDFREDSPQQ